jgi:hypothetical protein
MAKDSQKAKITRLSEVKVCLRKDVLEQKTPKKEREP